MDKFILQTKNRYAAFVLMLVSLSATIIRAVGYYKLQHELSCALIVLSILFAFYFLCKSNHWCIVKNLRGIFESKITDFRKAAFSYAFVLNAGAWGLSLILLHMYINHEGDTTWGHIGGIIYLFMFFFTLFVSKYSCGRKFVYNLKPKYIEQEKELDIRAFFLNDDDYHDFLCLLRNNNVYEEFNSNKLFKAAVIRKANDERWFSQHYMIKDLMDIVKDGKYYLNKPSLCKIYTSEDLAFLNHKKMKT